MKFNREYCAALMMLSIVLAIPTNSKAQATQKNVGYLNRFASINSTKIFEVLRPRDVGLTIKEMDKLANSLVSQNGIQIIFQRVAYASPNVDITQQFMEAYKSNGVFNPAIVSWVATDPLVLAINLEKIFNKSIMAKEMQEKLKAEFSPRQNALRSRGISD